jgi:hypothetical protein
MSESTRPSMQAVQRGVLFGILIGLVLGLLAGVFIAWVYVVNNPPVYSGGSYPNEMTNNYQSHFLAMTIDSYLVNPDPNVAFERLKTFDNPRQISILAERTAAYVAAGRGVEAQSISNLALSQKAAANWSDQEVQQVVAELTSKYQDDPARLQAISSFSNVVLGTVPVPTDDQVQESAATETQDQPSASESGGRSWVFYMMLCLLVFVILLLIVYLLGRRQFQARMKPTKKAVDWEGEGPAPLKIWSGTYTLGQDNYDEFFTIETEDNDFLGECGMGILDVVPDTSPKQVMSFDVGLFDKTDITTLSRVVMSQHAYNDDTIRAKIAANPQAEAVVAEPGKTFTFETSALRVDATIDEMEYGEGGNIYFEKLKVSLNLFLKEGADLKLGRMDIPEQFQ